VQVLFILYGCSEGLDHLARVDDLDTRDGLYHLALAPAPDPPVAGDAALTVTVTGAGEPVEAALSVATWMPEHSHGASDPPRVEALGGGEYEARWVYAMPGYWELTIEVDGPEGFDDAVVGYEVE